MENRTRFMVEYSQEKGGTYRWVTITTLLLAIGVIMRMVTPGVAGITPNWMIAMYCLAIMLTGPSPGRAAAIGLVAGALIIPFSKSALPYANLISEPLGAIICALFIKSPFTMKFRGVNLKPGGAAFLATLVSGLTFVAVTITVLSLPMATLYVMIPVVLTVTIVNTITVQLLYFPACKLLGSRNR